MKFNSRLSLLLILGSLLLAGCSGGLPKPAATDKPATSKVENLLEEARSAAPIRAAELRSQAARLLLENNQKTEALRVLEQVDLTLLPPALKFDIAKIKARAALDQTEPDRALTYLNQITETTISPLPAPEAIEYRELRAQAYGQQNDRFSEARELIQASLLAEDDTQRQLLHDRIWALLTALNPDALRQLLQSGGNSYYEQGWLELAHTLLTNTQLDSQNEAYRRWQTLWDSHPAFRLPPQNLGGLDQQRLQAAKIAILLPNQGPLAAPANAIKEGILQAHFRSQPGQIKPELVFLDSSQINTPVQLLPLIKQLNIDMVIGPLDKDFVTRLASNGPMPATVLALNYTEGPSLTNLFQFGLSAEDEARQAANRAWQQGHSRVASITPATDWGAKIQQAFIERFAELGGSTISSTALAGTDSFAANISSLLNTDASKLRYQALRQRLPGLKLEFEEHRRTDIEAIFLTALPNDARQIKPILAFNFAGNLPIYASSHVYSGSPEPVLDQDLNGIQFCASPWSLQQPSQDKVLLTQLRPNTETRFGRLYALGLDAYHLYPYLQQLQSVPGTQIQGETGLLSINPQGEVIRQLIWARFRDGAPDIIQ